MQLLLGASMFAPGYNLESSVGLPHADAATSLYARSAAAVGVCCFVVVRIAASQRARAFVRRRGVIRDVSSELWTVG